MAGNDTVQSQQVYDMRQRPITLFNKAFDRLTAFLRCSRRTGSEVVINRIEDAVRRLQSCQPTFNHQHLVDALGLNDDLDEGVTGVLNALGKARCKGDNRLLTLIGGVTDRACDFIDRHDVQEAVNGCGEWRSLIYGPRSSNREIREESIAMDLSEGKPPPILQMSNPVLYGQPETLVPSSNLNESGEPSATVSEPDSEDESALDSIVTYIDCLMELLPTIEQHFDVFYRNSSKRGNPATNAGSASNFSQPLVPGRRNQKDQEDSVRCGSASQFQRAVAKQMLTRGNKPAGLTHPAFPARKSLTLL